VQPIVVTGSLGNVVAVNVAVANVTDLGAFQFTLDYDPALLSLNSIAPASFLSSTGRGASCIQSSTPGHALLSCVTLGPSPPPGPSGSGVLADVRFTAIAGGTGTLALSNVILTTPGAVASAPPTLSASVTIDGATPTPCPGTCPTNTPAPTNTSIPTPSGAPVIGLNPQNPVVNQGDIFSVNVDLTNGANVGAFQFTLQLTTGRLELQSAVPGPFLGSTGRSIFCPPAQASLVFVTFGCVTQGTGIPGATGNGTLATLTFKAVGGGPGTFTFLSPAIADPFSVNIPVTATDGTFTVNAVAAVTATPCVGPCPTATATATPPATLTPVSFPSTCLVAASVCIQPDLSSVRLGQRVTVGAVANGVADLGAYQFELTFDPAVVSFVSIANGTFLGSTGRAVLCVSPIVSAGSVRIACSTLGPEPPPGPSGSGVLAVVTFQGIAAGVSPLTFANTILTNPAAVPIGITLAGGSISVTDATPTPCAGPCPTATSTSTPTLTPTPAPISCPKIAPTVVCVVPPAQTVLSGTQVSIDVVVDNVTDLGAYGIEIRYNPFVLTYVSATNDVFLGSTGRSVFCFPVSQTLTSIVFSCASTGGQVVNGTGILFRATFLAASAGTSPLTIGCPCPQYKFDVLHPDSSAILASAVSGSVVVQ